MGLFQKKRRFLPWFIPFILALIFLSLTGRSVRRAPWYEEAIWHLVAPPQRLLRKTSTAVVRTWSHYIGLIGVSKENDSLKQRIAELEGQLVRAREVVQENKRLKALLSYNNSLPQRTTLARVISSDPRAQFKSLTINRGYKDGVEPLMPVVGPRGLVGKVGRVAAHTARVLLIIDPNSAVDAVVQRSRARGLVVGQASRTMLRSGHYLTRLEYLRRTSDVREGDVLVTSGLDRIFPPGIPIGTLHELKSTEYGVFKEAVVVPFEDMAELQEVMVLSRQMEMAWSQEP